jgi:hypothetical protein
MPVFEIPEDAVQIALHASQPIAIAQLPELSATARRAVDRGELGTRPGTEMKVRRMNADRGATRDLRDWFIHAEVSLQQSPDEADRTLSRVCREAANVLIVAYATGRDFPTRR